jgi:hypothetical protein
LTATRSANASSAANEIGGEEPRVESCAVGEDASAQRELRAYTGIV